MMVQDPVITIKTHTMILTGFILALKSLITYPLRCLQVRVAAMTEQSEENYFLGKGVVYFLKKDAVCWAIVCYCLEAKQDLEQVYV